MKHKPPQKPREDELARQIEAQFEAIRATERDPNGAKLPLLAPLHKSLEQYVLLFELRLYCRYLAYVGFLQPSQLDLSASDFSWLKAWLAEKPECLFSVPRLHIYYLLVQLIDPTSELEDKEALVQNILLFSQTHQRTIGRDDRIDVLSIVTNYYIKTVNQGQVNSRPTLLLLYVEMIDIQHGREAQKGEALSPGIFKNVVALARPDLTIDWQKIQLSSVEANNAFDWVAAFIKQYGKRLKSVDAKAYIAFCEATNLFRAALYAPALQKLVKITKSQQNSFSLNVKTLKIMCLYELESSHNSDDKKTAKQSKLRIPLLLDAYRKQLDYWEHDNPSLSYTLAYHRAFIKAFSHLYALQQKGYQHSRHLQDRQQLKRAKKEQLAALAALSYPFVPWLREKLQALG